MAVTERVMGVGAWSLNLLPGAPHELRDKLVLSTFGFGHVAITPNRLDDNQITVANLLALSRYTGIYRERPSEFTIGGPGPVAWLGDEDDKGTVYTTGTTLSGVTFQSAVGSIRPSSLRAGTVQALGGSYTNTFLGISRRKALEDVCNFSGAEYRVTPELKLDAGTNTNLYATATTPTVIVQRRSSGRDVVITGIPATNLDTAKDLNDYTTTVFVASTGGTGSASVTPPFKDINGNNVDFTRYVDSSVVGSGNETAAAQAQLNRFSSQRLALTLSTDIYDIGGDIRCGDTIWVYDLDLGIYDTANQINYRGQTILPQAVRVYGYTWPFMAGMGCYFIAPDATGAAGSGATITDLTDWVVTETADTTVEIGAVPRPTR